MKEARFEELRQEKKPAERKAFMLYVQSFFFCGKGKGVCL